MFLKTVNAHTNLSVVSVLSTFSLGGYYGCTEDVIALNGKSTYIPVDITNTWKEYHSHIFVIAGAQRFLMPLGDVITTDA